MRKNIEMEVIYMEISVIIGLIVLFVITAFTNVLATLKTILMSKKIMNPVYLLVFLDAIILIQRKVRKS